MPFREESCRSSCIYSGPLHSHSRDAVSQHPSIRTGAESIQLIYSGRALQALSDLAWQFLCHPIFWRESPETGPNLARCFRITRCLPILDNAASRDRMSNQIWINIERARSITCLLIAISEPGEETSWKDWQQHVSKFRRLPTFLCVGCCVHCDTVRDDPSQSPRVNPSLFYIYTDT